MQRLFCLFLLFIVSACGDSSSGPSGLDWVGTYELKTVDGKAIPGVIAQVLGVTKEVLAGSVRLDENQTFSRSLSWRITQDGIPDSFTRVVEGTFRITGEDVRFESYDGIIDDGWLSGKYLTVDVETWMMRFER